MLLACLCQRNITIVRMNLCNGVDTLIRVTVRKAHLCYAHHCHINHHLTLLAPNYALLFDFVLDFLAPDGYATAVDSALPFHRCQQQHTIVHYFDNNQNKLGHMSVHFPSTICKSLPSPPTYLTVDRWCHASRT